MHNTSIYTKEKGKNETNDKTSDQSSNNVKNKTYNCVILTGFFISNIIVIYCLQRICKYIQ